MTTTSKKERLDRLAVRKIIVRASVDAACRHFKVGLPNIVWSNRMTATAGKASAKTLTFSIPLLIEAGEEECRETAYHEVAHFIDFKLRGRSDHGPEWVKIMTELGFPAAKRCHTLDRTHVYRWTVVCGTCLNPLKDYARRPSRLLRTHRSACCKARLHVQPFELAE